VRPVVSRRPSVHACMTVLWNSRCWHYPLDLWDTQIKMIYSKPSLIRIELWQMKKFVHSWVRTMAYILVAKRWLCKRRPFWGGFGSGNTFPLLGSRFLIMQQLDYNNGNWVFLLCRYRDVISKRQSQFSSFLHEDEESPTLEAVAGERPMKAQQAWKKA
jgi:hypothetical protein